MSYFKIEFSFSGNKSKIIFLRKILMTYIFSRDFDIGDYSNTNYRQRSWDDQFYDSELNNYSNAKEEMINVLSGYFLFLILNKLNVNINYLQTEWK